MHLHGGSLPFKAMMVLLLYFRLLTFLLFPFPGSEALILFFAARFLTAYHVQFSGLVPLGECFLFPPFSPERPAFMKSFSSVP